MIFAQAVGEIRSVAIAKTHVLIQNWRSSFLNVSKQGKLLEKLSGWSTQLALNKLSERALNTSRRLTPSLVDTLLELLDGLEEEEGKVHQLGAHAAQLTHTHSHHVHAFFGFRDCRTVKVQYF